MTYFDVRIPGLKLTVVAADGQQRGRGRLGRAWHSPPGAGLYVSVVLRPEALATAGAADTTLAAARITLTAGVALADALRAATGLPAAIKWPNDIVVGGRKVCGILAEGAAGGDRLRYVILGFGINVLAAPMPPDLAGLATSIQDEVGRPVERGEVFGESLACLAERLRQAAGGGFACVLDAWRARSPSSVGARVRVRGAGDWADAVTAGVDADGALLVRSHGGVRRVVAGEVRWATSAAHGLEDGHAARH
jgi:BirA family biotin operon repressor/biotin-[acetyl-CoA-carboxylase] ligase